MTRNVIVLLSIAVVTCSSVNAQRDVLAVRVRDPAGPVVGAHGWLGCRATYEMSALGALPRLSLAMAMPTYRVLVETSDARGMLRFANGDLLTGSGIVTTTDGLGALIVDLHPGRANMLLMEPMGAVSSTNDGEKITLFARAILPGGRTVTLPAMYTDVVRLPSGTYDAWALGDRGWVWQRLTLVSGQRSNIRFDGSALRLRSRGNYVHPEGRPEINVLAGRDEATLLGEARSASFVAWASGEVFGPQALPIAASEEPVQWPCPAANAQQQVLGPLPEGVPHSKLHVFGVVRSVSGGWQVRACSMLVGTATGPAFVLPQPPADDAWLLFVADGYAPQGLPWTRALQKFPFELKRGLPLRVCARDARGEPAVDLAVEYVPADMLAATVTANTNHRGEAHLGQALAPGALRISDARFANREIPLDGIPIDGVHVKVDDGEALLGTATWPDGKPAARALVELRDPRGLLRPAVRTRITDENGAFTFRGLTADVDLNLVLFASAVREQRTWSARLDSVRGDTKASLVLRNEDPDLRPTQAR